MATNPGTEQVADALLRSISHNLRTPLTSIQGALSYLQQDPAYHTDTPDRNSVGQQNGVLALFAETRRDLIENAVAEAEHLNRVIGNLLDMARLEAGAVQFTRTPCPVEDVIGAAQDRLVEPLKDRRVEVRIAKGLAPVPMDFTWVVKALVHVLDNAIRYSPAGTPIEVRARARGENLEITVADRGIGMSSDDLQRVFDKFYRVGRTEEATGTGVGLAICREVLTAHGGSIRAHNRSRGGTLVTMTLPWHVPTSQ